MIRCPKPGEPTPWDPMPSWPKPSKPKGGLIETLIDILTGGKKRKI